MKNRVFSIIAAMAVVLVISCDKLDQPYATAKEINVDTTKRKVLLEDYTGMKCVNCPGATAGAEALVELYKGQVILMAVHAGFFAVPDASGNYTTDYRVAEGVTWFNDFTLVSNPMGMVNRITYNDKKAIGATSWAAAVSATAQEKRVATIHIDAQYTAAGRGQVNTTITARFLEKLTGTYNLTVCLLEDSITGWQKNNDTAVGPVPDIENYVFNDMLRAVLNGAYGEELTNAVDTGVVYTKTYQYTPDPLWIPGHLSLVAFIANADTKEIIQAERKTLTD